MIHTRDTIFALSSGRLPAAIAVVRISGPQAGAALRALCGKIPEPRRAALARVRDPRSGEIIDEALALWFPAPKSETGEDVAELQLHGGRAVLAGVFDALGSLDGLRPAEAGEFTRRAFANGYLDLTEVEGLADLIGAETQAQRRQAFRHMKGLLGDKAEDWRRRLIEALALIEAGIDFADEDLPGDLLPEVRTKARALMDEIDAALDDGHRGERLRDGLVVAIAGPPNAGKSTLLNRIARRDAAIVSPTPGTTRDVIEVHLDLHGWPVTLLDTAGIRNTDDPVELEGVNRARARAAAADLVLWVVDAADSGSTGIPAEVRAPGSGTTQPPGSVGGPLHPGLPLGREGSLATSSVRSGGNDFSMVQESELLSDLDVGQLIDADANRATEPVVRSPDRSRSVGPEGVLPLASLAQRISPARRDEVGLSVPEADQRIGLGVSPPDGPRSAGPEGLLTGVSSTNAAQAIWLVRNKMDLLAGDASASPSNSQSNESGFDISAGFLCAEDDVLDLPQGAIKSPQGTRASLICDSAPAPSESGGVVPRETEPVGVGLSGAPSLSAAPKMFPMRTHRKSESNIENYDIIYEISAREGSGVDSLLDALGAFAAREGGEPALITRARHRQALTETRNALSRALEVTQDDLIAEELRLAARSLGRLTGRVDVEDILDVVFRDFCIGK